MAQTTVTDWSVNLSASAGVENNPYFTRSGSSGVTFQGTLEAQPQLVIQQPLTSIQLSGDVQGTFYSHSYPVRGSYRFDGSGTHRLSERTTLNAQASYYNSITGTVYDGRLPIATLPVAGGTTTGTTDPSTGSAATAPIVSTPVTGPLDPGLPGYLNDPSLGALGTRQQTYQMGASVNTALAEREQLAGGVSASLDRFGGRGLNDFNYVSPYVSWQHVFGEQTSAGLSFQVSFSNYLRQAQGDATTYSPQATLTHGFGRGWTLNGSVGVTFVEFRQVLNGVGSSTSVSGSAGLCKVDEYTSFCLTGAHQVAPSAFEGVRTSTIAAASFSYRLSPRSNLSVSGNYSHAGQPLQRLAGTPDTESLDYVNATGSYSHQFARLWSGFASVGYAQAFGGRVLSEETGANRNKANISAQAGVSYRFGRH